MEWVSLLGAMAAMTSGGAQLVGIQICFRIVRKGSTGDCSPAPFFAFFLNSCIWLKYSMMMELISLMCTSILGTVLQFVYLIVYYIYTTRKSQMQKVSILACILLFAPLYYANYYEVEAIKVSRNLGYYGCLLSVMCYASPLATVSEVVRYKSTESISFSLCIVNFIAATEWSLYGIAINNKFVSFPSFLGVVCGIIQFSLFCVYGFRKRTTQRVINA